MNNIGSQEKKQESKKEKNRRKDSTWLRCNKI